MIRVEKASYRTVPVSFTRRNSQLNDRQAAAWRELGADYIVDVPRSGPSMSVEPDFKLDIPEQFGRIAPLTVEIGGGGGEALIHAAQQYPDTDFLALEVWQPGVAKTLMAIRRSEVSNVRIIMVNAAEALSTMLPAASVDALWSFFPDPWPKKRHHKRRLVTSELIPSVHRVLKPGGVWRLATDWEDYAEQIRHVLASAHELKFSGEFSPRYEGRITTRFEQKGIDAGRQIFDMTAWRPQEHNQETKL